MAAVGGAEDLVPASAVHGVTRRPPETEGRCTFPADSTLLLYTDGLSETRDATGTFYDPASRLTGRTFPTPARLLSTLVDDVQDFSGGLTEDDMALLAVHRPTPPPATRI